MKVLSLALLCLALTAGTSRANDCWIASAHPLATKAGCDVLREGGNAFDAAVAVTAALGVVEPYSSGIGGGGFYLLRRAADGKQIFLDAREMAPAASSEAIYLDESGDAVASRSREGALAAGIPGIPAAIDHLSTNFGQLSLSRSLAPAIELANDGFPIDPRYVRAVGWVKNRLSKFPGSRRIFLNNGAAFEVGDRLIQPELSRTLTVLARDGAVGFYGGRVAETIVASIVSAGGNWTMDDLSSYRVIERNPISFSFMGATITTAPLPSSGGLVMAQTLNILQSLDYFDQPKDVQPHLVIEAMRRGYNDRARFMGDPDFSEVPVEQLLSREYAERRAKNLSMTQATPSDELPSVFDLSIDGEETTHFSIVDKWGNKVAATLSINGPFGSGMVAGETGILLNNHMDDFSIGIGKGNSYKLVGNRINGIEPHKRPLSSMSPTILETSRGTLVFGTPGGSRIISMVLLGLLHYVGSDESDGQSVVSIPRFHHQYLPDRVQVEPESFDTEWIERLEQRGHKVQVYKRKWGNMQAIECSVDREVCQVANDPRGKQGIVF